MLFGPRRTLEDDERMVNSPARIIALFLTIASGCMAPAAMAQTRRAARQPMPVLQPAPQPTVNGSAAKPATSKKPVTDQIDVFELGEKPKLGIVEVEPVAFQNPVPLVQGEPSIAGGPVPSGEEWVVGGGGIPSGVYLDDGTWVNDGDVINDGQMPSGSPLDEASGAYQLGDMHAFNGPYPHEDQSFETMDLPPGMTHRRGVGVSPFWVRADALLWSLEGVSLPPLVSTSAVGTSRTDAGVLGRGGTTTLLGDEKIDDSGRGGARIEIGGWSPTRSIGWHIAYFGLDGASETLSYDSASSPILARPFFSVRPTAVGPNADLIAFPNQVEGNLSVSTSTSLEGAEVMMHRMLAGDGHRQIQFMAGYQYNSLEDDLRINDFRRVTTGTGGLTSGTTLAREDHFQTSNRFNGASLGVLATMRRQRLSMETGMQMGLGSNHAQVLVNGSTTSSVPVTAIGREIITTQGGFLAQSSNIGSYEQDVFTMIPQLHVDLGYNINPQLRLLFGYRFLYWSQVARAGEQIDSRLNLSQIDPAGLSGDARPQSDFRLTDFWAQGINLGLDYRF